MDKYVCIHGHFYQPPRENPWLEAIELQDSAYPYHDWNERITAECYAPNMSSRILDHEGRITEIVNNYSKISFNFGPTLLSWMELKVPEIYKAILQADAESQKLFSGHGSAMAQCYNHMIMPLSNPRDKFTQVFWGIKDFTHRFKRVPEGMWLPETAVDLESLEILAEQGIRFTVLCPHQAKRVRRLDGRNWKDVSGARIDPTMAYVLNLPSGRKINIFFYDGPVSRAVAFEGLLRQGEFLANRLMSIFLPERTWPQLVHIATDGETFGHHHRYGEMALSYALRFIDSQKLAKITNYGEFLEKCPPTNEVEIFEKTSWSCAHGIERWRSDCGCKIAQNDFNQGWRAPLRDALDWLRDAVGPLYEEKTRAFFRDPWMARNDYIDILLNRTPETIDDYLRRLATHPLNVDEKTQFFKLMELERNAMLMYTSCGWFFDDISGLETTQILRYAGRAMELARELFNQDFEPRFLSILERARSNYPFNQNGRVVFDRYVKPSSVDLKKVAAHFALSSLFESYEEKTKIYCYTVDREDYKLFPSGKARLAIGKININSSMTGESARLVFGVFHLGDHNLGGGTRLFKNDEDYHNLIREVTATFERSDLPEFFRVMEKNFGPGLYTLKALFIDEQRKILDVVLDSTLTETVNMYRQIYEHHAPLMNFLSELNMPLPKPFYNAAEFTINTSLKSAIESPEPDIYRINSLLDEARRTRVVLDKDGLSFAFRKTLRQLMERLIKSPHDLSLLKVLDDVVGLAHTMPFPLDLWKAQNIYYDMLHSHIQILTGKPVEGNGASKEWMKLFLSLGTKLHVRVPKLS